MMLVPVVILTLTMMHVADAGNDATRQSGTSAVTLIPATVL